jgi:hypothetical protein
MSGNGDEFEQSGVNDPDRQAAAAADDATQTTDAQRKDAENGEGAASAESGDADSGVSDASRPTAEAGEPTHVASGIGVIDGSQPGAEHYGHDEGRDTLTTGESQRALSGEQEQRLPSMDQNNAPEVDKVAGIVAQTRQDVSTQPVEEVRHILAQRLEQAGISLPDSEVDELVKQVTTGDA